MPSGGGEPQRVTFEGSYNVSPRISPDGRMLSYIARNEGKFQVALLDLQNRQVQIITDSDRDESPSFAPNGRMILLATVLGGRGVLSAVSADGRFKQRLSAATGGDVREPAWGPFIE
jgi:TolB protein